MATDKLDRVFKMLLNRRVTDNAKAFYSEFGDSTINVHLKELWAQDINIDPTVAIADGVANKYTDLILTEDISVPGQASWYAEETDINNNKIRLKDWISDKYGPGYSVSLYTNNGTKLFPTDSSDWFFDYQTGIMTFSGNIASLQKPFKITGYRYVGVKGVPEVDLSSITNKVSTLEGKVETLEGKTSTLEGKMTTVEGKITTIEGNVTTIQGDITTAQGKITTIEEDITTLKAASGGASDGKIGTPTDGSWTDGFFDNWQQTTPVTDALDDISEILADLAPAKAGLLTGSTLTSNITTYTGKLSSGLDSKWYLTGRNPGDTVSTYTVVHSGTLTTPNTSTAFRCGKKNTPTTYGTLKLLKDGADLSTYDMTAGIGNNGVLNVTSIAVYNTLWAKANATASLTLTEEGYQTYSIQHTEAGITNPIALLHDSVTGTLSFSVRPAVSVITPINKYLSGIAYLTINTILGITYTAATGIFDKVYHSTAVSTISGPGFNNLVANPDIVPAYNDSFPVNKQVTLSIASVANNAPNVTVQLAKPNTTMSTSSAITGYRICTYGVVSTSTVEDFYDEDMRLIAGTNTVFNSISVLANGEAQVKNGVLEYGSTDYPSKTGNQVYERRFSKTSASIGAITLGGLTYTNISPYGTGGINVLMQLEIDGKFFDLGKAVGDKNGTGSGDSKDNSIGARVSGSSNTINWSFGTYSTAFNNHMFRLIIIFRNNTYTINKLTSI